MRIRKISYATLLRLLILVLIISTAKSTFAKKIIIDTEHRGIRLVGLSLPPTGRYDIDILPLKLAIKKIKLAINKIYDKSSFSAERIDILKKNGRVTLVYDAYFPKDKFSSVIIAAFFPDFFQRKSGGLKEFLVVIGRFGVKWPTDKLAAIIVHELVGHGLQHLRGRTAQDRKIDKECEALIFEEKAYQDFDMRRSSKDMQLFRRSMRNNWCSDFRQYLTRKGLNADKIWNYGKPDVPRLLTYFNSYIKYLREAGISRKAIAASSANRKIRFAKIKKRIKTEGSAKEILSVGTRYLQGLGVEHDIEKAKTWIRKSAELGNAEAQYLFGRFHYKGLGMPQSFIKAYMWFSLANIQGHKNAGVLRRNLKPLLSEKQIRIANKWITKWQPNKRG